MVIFFDLNNSQVRQHPIFQEYQSNEILFRKYISPILIKTLKVLLHYFSSVSTVRDLLNANMFQIFF